MPPMPERTPSAGDLLREWRQRRRLSQLALALNAGISQRHLSFVESGRSAASRDMLLLLAEELSIPLRERNALLVAGGFAPVYRDRGLEEPELEAARLAVEAILRGHEPYPALAVDRHWTMVSANRAVGHLISGVDEELLRPPVNALRLSLHPRGLAPRIRNHRAWRTHILHRLERQIERWPDPVVIELLEELEAYPSPGGDGPEPSGDPGSLGGIAVPLKVAVGAETLSFFSTTTVFGTALDVLLSELAIESFFPADPTTAQAMRRLAGATGSP